MIRTLILASAAAALTAPAFAENSVAPAADQAAPAADQAASARAQLDQTSGALQARQHLVRQGYVNVSSLDKDANGRWVGTAQKDGKTVYVAIKLPIVPGTAATN
jgi:hypothetical protein